MRPAGDHTSRPARDDAGIRLRTARLRRGLTQTTLAGLAGVSSAFVSMIETGQRDLTRISDTLALADALNISPPYLADGRHEAPPPQAHPAPAVPFPARTDPRTLARHHHLARQFTTLAGQDTRAAGDWLRRLARDPTISPWLLLDQLAAVPVGPPPRLTGNRVPSQPRVRHNRRCLSTTRRVLTPRHGLVQVSGLQVCPFHAPRPHPGRAGLSPHMPERTVPTATYHPKCTGELGLKGQITNHPG